MEKYLNKIIHGDCLEIMKQLPDKCIDLVLTDPPYGIGFDTEKESMSAGLRKDGSKRKYNEWSNPVPKNYPKEKWDFKPTKEYFNEIFRVSKEQIIWGGNYFTDMLPPSGGWLIWDKGVVMPTLSKCEMAWTSIMNHVEIRHYLWAGFRKQQPEERYHTTQKPLEIMKWSLSFSKNKGVVFDPFAGSCTTAIAAKQLGRNYICIEKEAEYIKVCDSRLASFQPTLL